MRKKQERGKSGHEKKIRSEQSFLLTLELGHLPGQPTRKPNKSHTRRGRKVSNAGAGEAGKRLTLVLRLEPPRPPQRHPLAPPRCGPTRIPGHSGSPPCRWTAAGTGGGALAPLEAGSPERQCHEAGASRRGRHPSPRWRQPKRRGGQNARRRRLLTRGCPGTAPASRATPPRRCT